jgi:hypothetical protein
MLSVPEPFADYCNLSVPRDVFPEALAAVQDVSYRAGGYAAAEGLMWLGDGGSIKHGLRHSVGVVSASGRALAELRKVGAFHEWLHCFAALPHRVTMLHATVDRQVDAPAEIERLRRHVLRGAVAFSRKALKWSDCSRLLSPGLADGRETGTVYLGRRTNDVWAKVYDKRNEILCRHAKGSVLEAELQIAQGPLTRYELCVGRKVGVTLRDVASPAGVFWHYCGDILLPRPEGAPKWVPGAEGFTVPPKRDLTPWQQLDLLLERSHDCKRLRKLALAMGPHGVDVALGRLRKYLEGGDEIGLEPSPGVGGSG